MAHRPDDPNRRVEADSTERGRVAADELSRVNGPLELQAAALALLLPADSERALLVWQAECAAAPGAQALRGHITQLPGAARLPWFEIVLARLRNHPLAVRQSLLAATRRLMAANATVRPIDRLHWLAMRQRLGELPAVSAPRGAGSTVSQLPQAELQAIAVFSAFLSRMVPVGEAGGEPAAAAAEPAAVQEAANAALPGAAWYAAVMAPWAHRGPTPPLEVPDTEGLVAALHTLQALPWMQRPVLARGWLSAALQHSRHGRLTDSAADALRLSCALLDSPVPPELARHYGETHSAGRP